MTNNDPVDSALENRHTHPDMLNQESILAALKAIKYPGYSRDIVSFGLVKQVAASQGAVSLQLQLTSHSPEVAARLKAECEQAIRALPEVKLVHIDVKMPAASAGGTTTGGAAAPFTGQTRLAGVKRVVAVASGKGGVGKSTCSVNLACALQQLGATVGLLDCDIYGPSIPLMMGINQRPTISAEEKMVPPSNHGVKLMSMGFLLEGDQPVIWRGPMIMKTIQQFVSATDWGALDYLLVDLPPGTGDAQLSLRRPAERSGRGKVGHRRYREADRPADNQAPPSRWPTQTAGWSS